MKLLERIIADEASHAGAYARFTKLGLAEDIAESLRSATLILASNVAQYYYTGTDQEHWPWEAFPNLAPPFETTFIEWRMPATVRLKSGTTRLPQSRAGSFGVLLLSGEVPTSFGEAPGYQEARWQWVSGSKWLTTFYAFQTAGDHDPVLLPLAGTFRINASGRFWRGSSLAGGEGDPEVGSADVAYAIGPMAKAWAAQDGISEREFAERYSERVIPALLTLSFMHCKNVKLVDHAPSEKLTTKRLRSGSPPLKYKTLEIEPMKQVLRSQGNSEQTGLKRALHICRGHFKDYREHGLFGKLKAVFWWDQAIRGSISGGAVVKDYSIAVDSNSPKNSAS